jgi:NAD-dependent SIR2 family protein deacetylase
MTTTDSLEEMFARAARNIVNSRALVITAGAGMGVDSGLPDFRGNAGFWEAYPPYRRLGISFVQAANPEHFEDDPAFGWGFYGHRTHLYRATVPHHGFSLLQQWLERFSLEGFVVTSNVDGQFQKAGFASDRILEVHGSIHHLQCLKPCTMQIWDSTEEIPVDPVSMRADYLPRCPQCGGVARPNVLMFGDYSWISERTARQQKSFSAFLERHQHTPVSVIEMGAGTAIPTIRLLGERLTQSHDATVIRINPTEPFIQSPHLALACGALTGLEGIERYLQKRD